jgi:uncharacterized membrane protein
VSTRLHAVVAFGTVVWAGAIPAAALSAAGQGDAALAPMAVLVYGIGSVVCHQRPERSFHLGATVLPVCARCTGIYAGAAVAVIVSLVLAHRRAYEPSRARMMMALAATPALLSLVYEWTTGVTPSNALRASTGICLGAAVAWLLTALLRDDSHLAGSA